LRKNRLFPLVFINKQELTEFLLTNLVDAPTVSKVLGCSKRKVYRLAKKGYITPVYLGINQTLFFYREEILAFKRQTRRGKNDSRAYQKQKENTGDTEILKSKES